MLRSLLSRLQLLIIYAEKIELTSPCWRYSLLTAMKLSNIVYYHNLLVLYLSPGFSFVEVDRILDLGKPRSNILSPPQNISLVTNIRLLNYDNEHYIIFLLQLNIISFSGIPKYSAGSSSVIFWYPAGSFE